MYVDSFDCIHTVVHNSTYIFETLEHHYLFGKLFFLQSYWPFSIFLKDFSVNLKSNKRITRKK